MGVVVTTGVADGLQLDEYALHLRKEVVRDNCPVCSQAVEQMTAKVDNVSV